MYKFSFLLSPALSLLDWVASKTLWKWDDKVVRALKKLKQLLLNFPELIPSVVNLARFGKDTIDGEQLRFKGSKEKQKALKIIYKLVKNAPKKDVEKVVKSVEAELKKK